VFTNLLLADEINRAPAKVQSALLEAMQETPGHPRRRSLRPAVEPFMVMATQNPDRAGRHLPAARSAVDRFMLKCIIDYPSRDDERRIMNRFTAGVRPPHETVMSMPPALRAARRARPGVLRREGRRLHSGYRLRHAGAGGLQAG
jgi:MoxR-like ATPase